MRKLVSSPTKLIYLVLGVIFLMLGVVGLLIPIIPGILFLVGAVYVFGKVSRRVHAFGERHSVYRDMSTRFDRMGEVGIADRVRVAGLMCLEMTLRGVDAAVVGIRRVTGGRTI